MTSKEIRKIFLKFFKERDHKVFASSSLVPEDPTLLLTAAGMVQFKPFFQGIRKPPHPRATSVQKCIRTTDIANVGRTSRHLTFFEMLGNFSFGDYYKQDAINFAWDFVTTQVPLEQDRIWATVYYEDDEAVEAWKKAGISPEKIVKLGAEDNFWSAGPTGPCGPCSEILYDQGEEFGCDKDDCRVGCDCDRYLELWNLVFMQYDRDAAGDLAPLKIKGIDTGMGLERIAAVLQGVRSNFETDLLFPILTEVAGLAKVKPVDSTDGQRTSLRIITDHIKAVTFLIADGVIPSNEGRGYILRRLLRRAVRHGKLLGIEKPFIPKIVDSVVNVMGSAYPELTENSSYIKNISDLEEERFNKTLKSGMAALDQVISEVRANNQSSISGENAFRLYDTFGFPIELTNEMALEQGLNVDEDGFKKQMEIHQKISSGIFEAKAAKKGLIELEAKLIPTEFLGHSHYKVFSKIVGMMKNDLSINTAKKGDRIIVVLDKTPFYATSGGQVGDSGMIISKKFKIRIDSTEKSETGLFLHYGEIEDGTVEVNDDADAVIDIGKRNEIERSHSSTHILHWALRFKFGDHVKQAGSLVEPGRFRFDFTLGRGLSQSELDDIENLVNKKIIENHPVRSYTTSMEYAKESGAMALFGEKYGDFVRVVESGDFSKELCGGTHAKATGDIGIFKIMNESSVGANLRRIEAVVGENARRYLLDRNNLLIDLSKKLGATVDTLAQKIDSLITENRELNKKAKEVETSSGREKVEQLIQNVETIDGMNFIVEHLPGERSDTLRRYCDLIKDRLKSAAVVLISSSDGKVNIVSLVTDDLVKAGFSAGKIVKEVAAVVGGGGGGRDDLAQAGGKNPAAVPEALKKARELLGAK